MKNKIIPHCLLMVTLMFLLGMRNHTKESILHKKEIKAVKGKLLFKDDFDQNIVYNKEFQRLTEDWEVKATHAKWEPTNNGIKSIYESGHMPVLTYKGNFKDVIIELDFRFFKEEEKWSACRISATNTVLNPRAYSASVWANLDNKSRSLGMVLEHDEWKPGEITTVDFKASTFKPGKWYTLKLELIGNYARATCNGITVLGTHDKFGITKNSIYLGVGTSPHELRNFKVFEALKN